MTRWFKLGEYVPNAIFVFGSNISGRHGAGAAKTALERFGAVYGQGIGLMGYSYGIPTKDRHLKVLDIIIIESYIDDFIRFTLDNKDMEFQVTSLGTGLAGYSHETIAPLFKGSKNCYFDERWKPFL